MIFQAPTIGRNAAPMLSPEGRVVMISGANRGIGRAIAERLGVAGYHLSLGVRAPAALQGLTDGLAKGQALAFPYEARSPSVARDWVRATHERFGRIDGVIANAGIMRPFTIEEGRRVKSARTTGYAMSKFAVLALTHGIRHSGWRHGIRATAICPGFVNTDMTAATLDPAPDEMTRPESIAELVATVLALPNAAALPELALNCVMEP